MNMFFVMIFPLQFLLMNINHAFEELMFHPLGPRMCKERGEKFKGYSSSVFSITYLACTLRLTACRLEVTDSTCNNISKDRNTSEVTCFKKIQTRRHSNKCVKGYRTRAEASWNKGAGTWNIILYGFKSRRYFEVQNNTQRKRYFHTRDIVKIGGFTKDEVLLANDRNEIVRFNLRVKAKKGYLLMSCIQVLDIARGEEGGVVYIHGKKQTNPRCNYWKIVAPKKIFEMRQNTSCMRQIAVFSRGTTKFIRLNGKGNILMSKNVLSMRSKFLRLTFKVVSLTSDKEKNILYLASEYQIKMIYINRNLKDILLGRFRYGTIASFYYLKDAFYIVAKERMMMNSGPYIYSLREFHVRRKSLEIKRSISRNNDEEMYLM